MALPFSSCVMAATPSCVDTLQKKEKQQPFYTYFSFAIVVATTDDKIITDCRPLIHGFYNSFEIVENAQHFLVVDNIVL